MYSLNNNFRRAWIKDEYLRIFGDGKDNNYPKPSRTNTSLPPKRPPPPYTSYNVPSANHFTEPEKNIIEDQIFKEFQRPVAGMESNSSSNVAKSLHCIERNNPWDNHFETKQSIPTPATQSQPRQDHKYNPEFDLKKEIKKIDWPFDSSRLEVRKFVGPVGFIASKNLQPKK